MKWMKSAKDRNHWKAFIKRYFISHRVGVSLTMQQFSMLLQGPSTERGIDPSGTIAGN